MVMMPLTQHQLCAQHSVQHLMHIFLSGFSQQHFNVGMNLLQMRELWLRDVNQAAQGHIAIQ